MRSVTICLLALVSQAVPALALLGLAASHAPRPLLAPGLASAGQIVDTDGDTMPDAWEEFFGLDPEDPSDAAGDPDGDGLTNAQEYAARRHPIGRHTRFFAEGSTGYFDTSVGVLNVSPTATAHVALALLTEGGGVVSHQLSLEPRQRRSVSINTVLGLSAAVSIIVESDAPIVADRFMTWGSSGVGASLDSGAPAPATTWYFAEGATGPFYLYYLFQNPGTMPVNVTVRYLVEGSAPVIKTRTLPPHSRTTVFVNQDDPALAYASLGAVVTSDAPIVAERAMYVQGREALGGGSASSASNQLATQWYFGEGSTGPFFHAFLSLLNPGATEATATVTYHMSNGSTASKAYTVPAAGRRTVYFNGEAESDPALSALATGPVWFTVSSTQPILGERAMWWSTWPWYEGHAAPGSTTTAVSWAVAEGRQGGPANEQTYVLIGNTSATAGQVRLTLIPDSGAPSTREVAIAAGERLSMGIGQLFDVADGRFSVIVDSLGTPAVPLAVDYARYRSANGLLVSGGGAAPASPIATPGDAAPSVTATTPAANATGVAVDANLTVTFSEPVTAGAGAFVLECPASTPIALTNFTSSPATTFTLDPAIDLPLNTLCRLRVIASAISDADSTDPPDTPAADVTVGFTTSTCAAIAVSPTTVPGGTINVAYAPVTFAQTGGAAPITWSVTAGALPGGVSLTSAGVLAGTPTASGPFSFTVTATDTNACTGSAPLTLSVLTGPNQAPSFTSGGNQTALEDGGPRSMPWATAISPGPPEESGQAMTFVVTSNTNTALFSTAPAISPAGTLTFTPAPNANGAATVTVVLQDNGGTASGGVDTSAPQTFTITVTPVNDAPGFTAGANRTVAEDSGAQTVAAWATTISPGPNEAGQTVTFVITNNTNAALFSAQPAVSATGTLTFTSAPDANGVATITLVAQDTGETANGGVNTSPAHILTITVTPVNDAPTLTNGTITYSTVGNTQLHVQGATRPGVASVSDASGVLTKSGPTDIDGPATPTAVAVTSFDTGEGTLTLSANGSFTYVPDAGFTGVDTFTVQVTDTVIPATVTVQITVTDMVWYVNNQTGPNNPPGSDGRSTDAYETLAEVQAAAGPSSTIFIFNGLTATTPLTGGIALENGQKLLGEGVGLTIAGFGAIVPAGTRPRIVAAGDAVTVAANTANGDRTGVQIRGLNLASTSGNGVDVSSANTQALGVRISENTISGSGPVQDGIVVAAGSSSTATLAVHDNIITANGSGMQIARTAGTVFITAFDDNVVSGATASAGIVVTGPNVFFDATPGGVLDTVAGGVTAIGSPGNGVGSVGMLLTSVTGDLSFTDLDIVSSNGAALSAVGTGPFTGASGTRLTVGASLGVLTATGGAAAALTNLTADLQLASLTSTNSAANGVLLTQVLGTFTAPAGSAITNAATADIFINGGSANVTYAGAITDDLGTLVSVTSTTGGAKSFTGAITDGNDGDGNGISLTSNTGATITFSGGLVLSTGANAAFTATGGGTINVCDENPCNPNATGGLVNTLTTTTATALNVANTTIGANHLEFRSISSNGGSNTGIIVDNTGSSGGLKVRGTGAAASGGTIANKTGADGSTSTGIGIYLNNTANVSLDRMQLNDFDNYAIRGLLVNGLVLSNSVINAATGMNGTSVAVDEGSVSFGVRNGTNGLTGTASVVNTTIEDGVEDSFSVFNTAGTLTLTMDNISVSGSGNDGVVTQNFGTATVNIEVRNSDFSANVGDHFNATADGSANLHVQFGNNGGNTLTGGAPGALGQSIGLQTGVGWAGSGNAFVSNNSINGAVDTPININIGGTGVFEATVDGNTIGTAGVAGSGTTANKDAIRIVANGDASVDATPDGGTLTAAVTNNTIQQISGRGILALARDGGTAGDPIRLHLTITGNLLRESPNSGGQGIRVEAGATSTDDVLVHANIGGAGALANVFQDDWGANLPAGIDFDEIRITHGFSANCQFILTGLGANTSTVSTVAAYLSGRNTLPGGVGVASASITGGGVYETGGVPPTP